MKFFRFDSSLLLKRSFCFWPSVFLLVIGMIIGSFGPRSQVYADDPFKDQLKNFDRDDIHSIHRKLYTKKGRHEISSGLGGIFNNGGYALWTAQYTYHLYENLGIEAANGGIGFQVGDNNRMFFYQASAVFSPLYGKISLFTWAVANFDLYVVGGAGAVSYQGLADGSSLMANIGIGQRFFINEWLSFKLEFRDYFYKASLPGGSQILNNYALTGGLGLMIPMKQRY